jgi:hypothetical protein
MGHVVNYAYRLFEEEEWIRQFGSITQPYLEDYRPSPFSRRYVRHLPGWYAQKHPDEDWSETFAVWMTPGFDWRAEYAGQAGALAKLEYCARTMTAARERDPLESSAAIDEDVKEIAISIEQYYSEQPKSEAEFPMGLDGALRTIFDETVVPGRKPASALIRKRERELLANVFRWTGHFPERTRGLVRHLSERAEQLGLVCSEEREIAASIALTTLVTALAMNWIRGGSYGP